MAVFDVFDIPVLVEPNDSSDQEERALAVGHWLDLWAYVCGVLKAKNLCSDTSHARSAFSGLNERMGKPHLLRVDLMPPQLFLAFIWLALDDSFCQTSWGFGAAVVTELTKQCGSLGAFDEEELRATAIGNPASLLTLARVLYVRVRELFLDAPGLEVHNQCIADRSTFLDALTCRKWMEAYPEWAEAEFDDQHSRRAYEALHVLTRCVPTENIYLCHLVVQLAKYTTGKVVLLANALNPSGLHGKPDTEQLLRGVGRLLELTHIQIEDVLLFMKTNATRRRYNSTWYLRVMCQMAEECVELGHRSFVSSVQGTWQPCSMLTFFLQHFCLSGVPLGKGTHAYKFVATYAKQNNPEARMALQHALVPGCEDSKFERDLLRSPLDFAKLQYHGGTNGMGDIVQLLEYNIGKHQGSTHRAPLDRNTVLTAFRTKMLLCWSLTLKRPVYLGEPDKESQVRFPVLFGLRKLRQKFNTVMVYELICRYYQPQNVCLVARESDLARQIVLLNTKRKMAEHPHSPASKQLKARAEAALVAEPRDIMQTTPYHDDLVFPDHGTNKDVLIVDDCRFFCNLMYHKHGNKKLNIEFVHDGRFAVDKMLARKADPYALVIMDQSMVKMNGDTAITAARASGYDGFVVLYSSTQMTEKVWFDNCAPNRVLCKSDATCVDVMLERLGESRT